MEELLPMKLVRVWMTLLVTFPSFSLTRASSLLPFSMVKIRLLSGIVVRSHPARVVLIICVGEMRSSEAYTAQESARTGHTVLTTIHSNSCGMEAAIPTSSSTSGVFNTAIRIFLLKCPRTAGDALSSTNLFFSPEEKGRAFSDVLKEVQEYISSKYSTLILDGDNEEVKQHIKRYISLR